MSDADKEDLALLKAAQAAEGDAPTMTLDEVRRMIAENDEVERCAVARFPDALIYRSDGKLIFQCGTVSENIKDNDAELRDIRQTLKECGVDLSEVQVEHDCISGVLTLASI